MSKQQPAIEKLHKKYKKCRNIVISNLRNAEHNYYSEQLEITGTDLSKRWKVMKQILGIDNKKTCGVPQGSILGPLFFIAYMNDIFQASKYLYNILYADDTSILVSGSDLQKLVREMNRELELISEWFKANKLTLNIDKTYYMVFHRGRRKFKNNIELVINDRKN